MVQYGGQDAGRREEDVDTDTATANSRMVKGGVGSDDAGAADATSTTGSTPSGEFVGRTAGADTGYEEETGAEVRAREE
ncbi:MAG: hypothetical protein M3Q27_13330 [Actinomycetota bacterium]|nr:hypothetical protein [Actinomycetota bacterium]